MWHEHENAVCDYTHKHTHIDRRTVARQTNNRPTTDENVTMRCSQHCTEFVLSVNVKPATGCIHLTRNHFKCASSHNTIIQMYAYANGEDSGCQIWRICTFDIISSEATFFLIFRSIRSCTRYIFFFSIFFFCVRLSLCVCVYIHFGCSFATLHLYQHFFVFYPLSLFSLLLLLPLPFLSPLSFIFQLIMKCILHAHAQCQCDWGRSCQRNHIS